MTEKLKNSVIRALRTFFQTAIGVYLAGLIVSPALGDLGNVGLLTAAAAAGIVSVLHNVLEELGPVSLPKG